MQRHGNMAVALLFGLYLVIPPYYREWLHIFRLGVTAVVAVRTGGSADVSWLLPALTEAAMEQLSSREQPVAWAGAVQQQMERMLRTSLAQPGGTILVAESDRTPVGYILFYVQNNPLTGEPEGMVTALHVHPGWRRRGVANRLVTEAEGHMRALGARGCSLVVALHNEASLSFWTRRGYFPERVLMGRRLPL